MSDVVAFLNARLDEDEAAANAGARRVGMPWRAEPQSGTPGGLVIDDLGLVGSTGGRYAAEHIARHDPARVLRSIEADRELLTGYRLRAMQLADNGATMRDDQLQAALAAQGAQIAAIQSRASVYSDHPDYRQEWKP